MALKKITISNFLGGIGLSSKYIGENIYQSGSGIDIFGLISAAQLGEVAASPEVLNKGGASDITTDITDFVSVDISGGQNMLYGYSSTKIYQINLLTETVTTTNYPVTFTNGTVGKGIAFYNEKIHYANGNTQIGTFTPDTDPSDDKADDTFTGLTSETSNRPMVTGNDELYFADGNSISKINGSTLTTNVLSLPTGFIITDLVFSQDTLFIAGFDGRLGSVALLPVASRIFLWDTFSDTWYSEIAVEESLIIALDIFRGSVWLLGLSYLRRFNGTSFEPVLELENQSASIAPVRIFGNLSTFKNNLIWGNTSGEIVCYGNIDPRLSDVVTIPFVGNTIFLTLFGARSKIIASSNNATNSKKLMIFSGNSTKVNATLKTRSFVIEPSRLMGVRINFRRGTTHDLTVKIFNENDGTTTTLGVKYDGSASIGSKMFISSSKLLLTNFHLQLVLNTDVSSDIYIMPNIVIYYEPLDEPYLATL